MLNGEVPLGKSWIDAEVMLRLGLRPLRGIVWELAHATLETQIGLRA